MKFAYFLVLTCIGIFQSASAQTMKAINLEPGDKLINQGVSISIDFTSEKKPWCGLRVDWGNGKSQPVRVGHDGDEGAPTSPIKLSNTYNTPGKYNISVKGELLVRGLTGTALPCEIKTGAAEVVVIDPVADTKFIQRNSNNIQMVSSDPPNQRADSSLREIIVVGYGKDIPDAAQNAAQNALKEIVGSFIDSNTVLEKRVEIQDGVRSETKNIRSDVKEYSQGSIKSFEVLDVKQENFVKLTARVVVRVEDFQMLVRKIAESQTSINPGIFARAQSQNIQNDNLAKLFLENVLAPLSHNKSLELSFGSQILSYESIPVLKDAMQTTRVPEKFKKLNPSFVVGFKVNAAVNESDRNRIIKTLNNISRYQDQFSPSPNTRRLNPGFTVFNDASEGLHSKNIRLQLTSNDSDARFLTIETESESDGLWVESKRFQSYLIGATGFSQSLDGIASPFLMPGSNNLSTERRFLSSCRTSLSSVDKPKERLVVELLSKDGAVIESFIYTHSIKGVATLGDIGIIGYPSDNNSGSSGQSSRPWQLLHLCNNFATFQRSFWVLLSVKPDTLKNSVNVKIRLEN